MVVRWATGALDDFAFRVLQDVSPVYGLGPSLLTPICPMYFNA